MFRFEGNFYGLILTSQLFVGAALADALPEPWERERLHAIGLAEMACTGEPAAVAMMWADAERLDNPASQNALGWLTENCVSFTLTKEEIASWYKKSAQSGYPIGMYSYGVVLLNGDGVPADVEQGEKFIASAADAGYSEAALALAYMYVDADVLDRDLVAALNYIEKAKRLGANDSRVEEAKAMLASAEAELEQSRGSGVDWDKAFSSADGQTTKLAAAGGDAGVGQNLYRARCFACHALDSYRSGVGPNFYQLFGRTAGSTENFRYSSALEEAGRKGLIWTTDNVGDYLAAPKDFMEKWSWDRQRHAVTCRKNGNTRRNEERQDLVRILDCEVAFSAQDMRDLAAYLDTQ